MEEVRDKTLNTTTHTQYITYTQAQISKIARISFVYTRSKRYCKLRGFLGEFLSPEDSSGVASFFEGWVFSGFQLTVSLDGFVFSRFDPFPLFSFFFRGKLKSLDIKSGLTPLICRVVILM